MRDFKSVSKLRKVSLNLLVNILKPTQISHLREIFEAIDKDNSGTIEPSELIEAFKKSGYEMDVVEVESILAEIDPLNPHKIRYTDFIAATMSVQEFLNEKNLEAIFNMFDVDN